MGHIIFKQMKKLGITGEMGSGKSYCSKIFEQYGVPVFYTDDVARDIINTNDELKKEIIKEFGDVYDENGLMIKPKIRSIIFVAGGEDKLKILNDLSHHYVFKAFEEFCIKNKDKKYIIAESAILYETKLRDHVDDVIYVYAKESLRMKRAFDRSGFDEIEYKQRMKDQIPSDEKMKLSNFVIFNNEGDDIKKQIEEINNTLNT